MTKFRIRQHFGQHHVEALDNNGVWIVPEGGVATSFGTRAEAEDYISEWDDAECGEIAAAIGVNVEKLSEPRDDDEWFALTGVDLGTGCTFDHSEYGRCADGTIVNAEGAPLTDGDWETIAVRNSLPD